MSAVLFVAFQGHLRHRYRLGGAFSVVMLVGMAGHFIAGVVPIGHGPSERVHVAAALTLGASIPVVMWRFAVDQPSGVWRRWCYGLFWLEVAACAAGIALSRNQVAPLAEILPALAFHVWVAVVTFGPGPVGPVERREQLVAARVEVGDAVLLEPGGAPPSQDGTTGHPGDGTSRSTVEQMIVPDGGPSVARYVSTPDIVGVGGAVVVVDVIRAFSTADPSEVARCVADSDEADRTSPLDPTTATSTTSRSPWM